MKKKLLLMCLVGLLPISLAYAKCDGGVELTNSVGTTFCKSNVTMNWWSAFSWCKANDLNLATIYELCPSWDGNSGSGKCSELSGRGSGCTWSATASQGDSVFFVCLSDGTIDDPWRSDTDYWAFCK